MGNLGSPELVGWVIGVATAGLVVVLIFCVRRPWE